MPVSDDQLRANRENAQHSTGPKSPQGKAISSHNRLTHSFRTDFLVFQSTDEFGAYQICRRDFYTIYQPETYMELAHFEMMMNNYWKYMRALSMESRIQERLMLKEINDQFPSDNPEDKAEAQLPDPLPGKNAAELLEACQSGHIIRGEIFARVMEKEPKMSLLTIARYVRSFETGFTRHQRELERLIKMREPSPESRRESPKKPASAADGHPGSHMDIYHNVKSHDPHSRSG